MIKSKTLVNLATGIIIAGAVYLAYRAWHENAKPADDGFVDLPVGQPQEPDPTPPIAAPTAAPATNASNSVRQAALVDHARQWEAAASGLRGEARAAKLKDISESAIATLGPCEELFEYHDFLNANGVIDECEWFITEGLRGLFSGPHAETARKWMLDLPDSHRNRRVWLAAGSAAEDLGFKEYLNGISNSMIQDRVLTGYCCRIAATDGNQAMKLWVGLKPPGVSSYGMIEICRQLSENSDFAAISATFQGDVNNLPDLIRAELLKRWAAFHPDAAADYVIAHSERALPKQMAVVVARWADKDPEAAAAWLTKAEPGAARDIGMATLAEHWAARDPEQAWQLVRQIADKQQRLTAGSKVTTAWGLKDHAAAIRAMTELNQAKP
jgi:hypothetical protein